MSTVRTFLRLAAMRRKEGVFLSARWAAGLMWRNVRNDHRTRLDRRAEVERAARQRL